MGYIYVAESLFRLYTAIVFDQQQWVFNIKKITKFYDFAKNLFVMSIGKLKCIVIDDSALQRLAVCKLVSNHTNLTFVAEYDSALAAQKGLIENKIDLVFLDIEMPLINGFQFIESLKNRPQIILITSKPDYAMQAFDYDVTDYLLKPIAPNRFNTSIKKALLNRTIIEAEEESHIFVSSKLKKVKVFLNDIKWIEGLGDYLKIITDENSLLVLSTMKAFMNRLPKEQFLRVHKSYIVNLDKVEKFNGAQVEVCGRSIPLSRHKKADLEEALLKSSE